MDELEPIALRYDGDDPTFAGVQPLMSIAVSLKRIADALQPPGAADSCFIRTLETVGERP